MTDNPLAFPSSGRQHNDYKGMTLRDWFAGQALAGLLAPGKIAGTAEFARAAYSYADAMLAARAKGQ